MRRERERERERERRRAQEDENVLRQREEGFEVDAAQPNLAEIPEEHETGYWVALHHQALDYELEETQNYENHVVRRERERERERERDRKSQSNFFLSVF